VKRRRRGKRSQPVLCRETVYAKIADSMQRTLNNPMSDGFKHSVALRTWFSQMLETYFAMSADTSRISLTIKVEVITDENQEHSRAG
jgi:hypothetical protein